jgi:hypothetical protein
MTTQPPEVDYNCLDCHKLFKVRQGSDLPPKDGTSFNVRLEIQ